MNKTYTDHEGRMFHSIQAMGDYWGVPESTLHNRLFNLKMPVKDALTMNAEQTFKIRFACEDHLGNKYESKAKMCEAYGIPRAVYFSRIGLGWSVKDALTTPIMKVPSTSIAAVDHTGRKFDSVNAMCKFWKISRSTYRARIDQGWTIKDALTKPKKKTDMARQSWTDHLGNKYESLNKMCEAYGINHYIFNTRYKKLGWPLERCLTEPLVIASREVTDEFGHTFLSATDAANFYKLPSYCFQDRNFTTKSFRRAVDAAFKDYRIAGTDITVKKIVSWPFFLCIENNSEIMLDLREILDMYHNSPEFQPVPARITKDDYFKVLKLIKFPVYQVKIKDKQKLMTYWEIMKYVHDTNFGLSAGTYHNQTNTRGYMNTMDNTKYYDIYLWIPGGAGDYPDDIVLHVSEGTGDNLLPEDIDEGWTDYVDYEIFTKDSGINDPEDSGMVMLTKPLRKQYASLDEILPEVYAEAFGEEPAVTRYLNGGPDNRAEISADEFQKILEEKGVFS